jgi:hypothetical protein
MNSRGLNPRRILPFAAAALAWLVLALGLAACGDDNATTAPATLPPGTAEATVLVGPTKAPAEHFPIVVPTPPVGFVLPEKRPCLKDWGRISDDGAGYSICVPPGWGIPDPDLNTDGPVANAVLHWGNPAIFSPEAFPWPVGDEVKVGEKMGNPDSDFARVILFPGTWRTDTPAPTVSNTCEAKQGAVIAGLPAAACEYRFDRVKGYGYVPNPSGSWCGRLIFVSLPSAKPSDPTDEPFSAVLGIIVQGRCDVIERYQGTLSEMLDGLQVVP